MVSNNAQSDVQMDSGHEEYASVNKNVHDLRSAEHNGLELFLEATEEVGRSG